MTKQNTTELYTERIGGGKGFTIYRITGNVYKFSTSELIDACDYNNWSGLVYMRSDYYAEVKVYTD